MLRYMEAKGKQTMSWLGSRRGNLAHYFPLKAA